MCQFAVEEVMRFGELRRSVGGVMERMLTKQLGKLRKMVLLHQEVYHRIAQRVEYSLKTDVCTTHSHASEHEEIGKEYERHNIAGSTLKVKEIERSASPRIAYIDAKGRSN